MIWLTRNKRDHYAAPYRIYSEIQGFSAWIYGKTGSARLGWAIPTLDQAKALCEAHHDKQKAAHA